MYSLSQFWEICSNKSVLPLKLVFFSYPGFVSFSFNSWFFSCPLPILDGNPESYSLCCSLEVLLLTYCDQLFTPPWLPKIDRISWNFSPGHPVFREIICLVPSILFSVSHQLSRTTDLPKSKHGVLVAVVPLKSTIIIFKFPLLLDTLKEYQMHLIVFCFISVIKRLHSTGQKPDLHESMSTLST